MAPTKGKKRKPAPPQPARRAPQARDRRPPPEAKAPSLTAVEALSQLLGSTEEAEEVLDPATVVPHLKKRVGEAELQAEARREEIETLQAQVNGSLAMISALQQEIVSFGARLESLESTTDETRARLDVLDNGGLRQLIARLMCLEAVDRALLAPVPWESACARALSVVSLQFGAVSAGLLLLESDGSTLRVALRHPDHGTGSAAFKLILSPSAGQAFGERETQSAEVARESKLLDALCPGRAPESGVVFSSPLAVSQRPRGVVSIVIPRPEGLAGEDVSLFAELVSRIALAFEAEVSRRKADRTNGAAA